MFFHSHQFQSFRSDFEFQLISSSSSHSIPFMLYWFLGVRRSYIVPCAICQLYGSYKVRALIPLNDLWREKLEFHFVKMIKSLFCTDSVTHCCRIHTHTHTHKHWRIGFRHSLTIRLSQCIIRIPDTRLAHTHTHTQTMGISTVCFCWHHFRSYVHCLKQ